MKKSSVFLYVAVFLFIGSYAAYNIYLNSISNIDTQYAMITQIGDSVSAECFVVRDENQSSGEKNSAIIKNKGDGTYIPYVSDGSRVAAGDTIALYFESEESAKAYREKQNLQQNLEYYEKLQNQSVLSMLDIDKLENTINDNLILLSSVSDEKNYSDVSELVDTLKYDISAKKIAMGEKADFSKQIKKLNSQIKKLSSSEKNYKSIKASFPGYYISNVDGFESAADYDKVSSITCAQFDALMNSDAQTVSSSTIGKIIDEYNWYAICKLPKASLEKVKKGSKVSVSFENSNVTDIEMIVCAVSPVDNGYAAVTLVSNEMNSDIALLRKEKITIVTDMIEGLKIPRQAVRNAQDPENTDVSDVSQIKNLGVYILYGQVVRFREIDVVYYGNDYVVAKRDTDSSDSLKLYDMIITKGRNLYDGKIIN